MKTVIQELIELINNGKIHSMLDVLAECHCLLEKEKQQILTANNRGYKVGRKDISETANEYYEDTFGDSN